MLQNSEVVHPITLHGPQLDELYKSVSFADLHPVNVFLNFDLDTYSCHFGGN